MGLKKLLRKLSKKNVKKSSSSLEQNGVAKPKKQSKKLKLPNPSKVLKKIFKKTKKSSKAAQVTVIKGDNEAVAALAQKQLDENELILISSAPQYSEEVVAIDEEEEAVADASLDAECDLKIENVEDDEEATVAEMNFTVDEAAADQDSPSLATDASLAGDSPASSRRVSVGISEDFGPKMDIIAKCQELEREYEEVMQEKYVPSAIKAFDEHQRVYELVYELENLRRRKFVSTLKTYFVENNIM